MAAVITDIEKWKINVRFFYFFKHFNEKHLLNFVQHIRYNYPFLKDLWDSYDNFDNTVQHDEKRNNYNTVCGMILNDLTNDNTENYNFCMKILRNLSVFPENVSSLNFKPERCNNLNYWIYNSIKKHNIQDNLIMKCFEDYFELTKRATDMVECKYHSYNESYDDPMIAIKLNIFNTYVGDVKDALMNSDESTALCGQKFVCECFEIYKDRYETLCPNKYSINEKQRKTCDKLDTFRNTYVAFLLRERSLVHKIPSFDNIEIEYETKCQLYEQQKSIATRDLEDPSRNISSTYPTDKSRIGSTLTPDAVDNPDRNLLNPKGEEITGSSMSSTISTAVGTMAGASSVLALLYKVNKNFI
ncbi:hypothetical protein PVIIG_05224 [Plasmodium vivax India VII]|uniref:Uncharacterized protein n=1 Tax=Plasmodium vivax India VII TaxID=1077284 RepID=A0A0J9S4S7_PLAVI|nr:hypothetical protein PVIIG_05224 [Plasmodium vivax India VII]